MAQGKMAPVAVVDHSAALGGAQLNLLRLAEAAPQLFTFILLENGPLVDELRARGACVEVEPLNKDVGNQLAYRRSSIAAALRFVRAMLRFRSLYSRIVQTENCHAVVFNSLRSVLLAQFISRRAVTTRYVMVRDILAPPHFKGWRRVLATRCTYRLAHMLIANSRAAAAVLTRPAHVVHPFIDRSFFEPVKESTPRLRIRILLLGRLAPWKGQREALSVLGGFPDIDISIAGAAMFGESEYEEEIKKLAASMPSVRILGHIVDVRNAIDEHDLIVHSSIWPEPFGQVVVQGMARARVVVASALGGPMTTISHGTNGFLCDFRNPAEAREVLETAIAAVRHCPGITRAARKESLKYHPDNSIGEFLEILRSSV